MIEKIAIARPYAKAAFEIAVAHKQLKKWSDMLNAAALVVKDKQLVAMLKNPNATQQQCAELLIDVCSESMFEQAHHFIFILAENNRLIVLPEIEKLFAQYRADYEKTMEVEVVSVFELNKLTKDKLTKALSIRFQRDISLNCRIDKSLIGGVLIRAGDLVINGSVQGRLANLERVLV